MLVPEIENLLTPILWKAVQYIETIHALLLLCLWPIPQPKYFQNPAWNYIGLAINAAMQLQCHNLSQSDSALSEWIGFGLAAEGGATKKAKARTWLGCVEVGIL